VSRTSPYKRALAARMIRDGKSYTEAGRAIGRNRRTITRWMGDESFLNMLHAHGVLTAGPLRVHVAVDDVLHDLPTEESWLWVSVPDASVLGSLVVDDATHLRVAFIPPERVPFGRPLLAHITSALAARPIRLPISPGNRRPTRTTQKA
jgi:Homeodomain-like domain